jgi:hypothetical protein
MSTVFKNHFDIAAYSVREILDIFYFRVDL